MNSMQSAAQMLSSAGRYGDTMLAHINPDEAALLQALGGSGTINPETGLPEYFSLKKIGKKLKKGVAKIAKVTKNVPGVNLMTAPLALAGGGNQFMDHLGTLGKHAAIGGSIAGLGSLAGAGGMFGGAGGASGGFGSMLGGGGGASNFLGNSGFLGGSDFLGGGTGGSSGIGGSLFGGGSSGGGFDFGSLLGGGSGAGGFDLGGIGGSLFGGNSGAGGGSSPWGQIGNFLGGALGGGQQQGGASILGALGSAGLGALAGGLGGGKKPTTLTTNSLQPWQQPYVQQAMGAAQQQFQSAPNAPAQSAASSGAVGAPQQQFGQIRDRFSQLGQQQFGINDYGLQNAASSLANTKAAQAGPAYDGGYLKAANNAAGLKASIGQEGQYISDTLGGKYLNPESNPYLKGTYDKAARSVISNNDSLFASGGRFNSGASQRALATGLGDVATDLYGQNYQAERSRMGDAAQMAAAQSGRQDSMTQFGVGQQLNALGNFGQRQDGINQYNAGQTNDWNRYTSGQNLGAMQSLGQRSDAMTQFGANNAMTANQNALGAQNSLQGANNDAMRAGQYQDAFNYQKWQSPWQGINNYLGAVGGNYGSTSTTNTPSNAFNNVLEGATGGLGIYGQLFGNG